MKTINYKGKGEHSVNELELIIEQQAEELHLIESGQKQLATQGISCSASDVISKIKHLPESDFSEDGQLKLLRVCGNALGLYKSVKWMQKHS